MKPIPLVFAAGALVLASCASDNAPPGDEPQAPAASATTGSFFLKNDSASALSVQVFEAAAPGGVRTPRGDAFTIAPGTTESRQVGAPGRAVSLTIRASGQDVKYLSGEWVVSEAPGGFRLYAFTDNADTVRLYWNDRNGQEIAMQ